MPTTRRTFCTTAALAALQPRFLRAQSSARADVAAIEHDRILAEAAVALKQSPKTLTPSPAKDPHDFYSEAESPASPKAFRTHVNALIDASSTISTLTAAFVLTHDDRYASQAATHLSAWFIDSASRMNPTLQYASATSTSVPALAAGVIDGVALAEIARSIQFLVDVLPPENLAAIRAWFTSFLSWLSTTRNPVIARDTKDLTASAWLLLASASARLLGDDANLNALRHRFKQPTLRNQINANGIFQHEITTDNPYRNTLFNFDMLAGACELLSTPFASLWPYELEDGPGLRAVVAFLYPVVNDPARWPYPADATHFRDVPRRRPGFLFAGRAFTRPEYVDLWRSLPSPTIDDALRATFPIRQPLLWITRAPHNA